ncbi:MAG: glycosyltransferase [bacterium]|nr:glycosyltransferase [bacterium]
MSERKVNKILFYSPVHLMHGGGCERWHIDVTTRLKKAGYEVKIITGDFGNNDLPEVEVRQRLGSISYTEVHTRSAWGGAARVPDKQAEQVLAEAFEWADAVHFIFGFIGQDLLIRRLKRRFGTKVIVGIHAPLFYENRWHNWYVATISRYLTMPSFDGFMALNPGEYQKLKKWRLPHINFIPSGVDVDKFVAKPDQRDPKTLTFLFAGRFEVQKAPDLAAKGIARFLKKSGAEDVCFRFIGSGSMEHYLKELKEKYPKQIDLVGYTTQPVPYFQSCDVFFLPSRQEPFGLVIVEAMATGAPVLASKAEGPVLMISEGKTGWFIDPLDSKTIAARLADVYNLWQKNHQVFLGWQKRLRLQGEKYSIDASVDKMRKTFF